MEEIRGVQRGVIRYALGARFTCSREFLEGEGGMSGFIEREIKNKLRFSNRLKINDRSRWAKQIQDVKMGLGIRTSWDRRKEYAARFIGYNKKEWEETQMVDRDVGNLVTAGFDKNWKEKLSSKSSLRVYMDYKDTRGQVQHVYTNGLGSGLLADARAGVLDTKVMRAKFAEEEVEEECRVCRVERETMEHVVLDCGGLGGKREIEISVALGLKGKNLAEIELTKTRLCQWRRTAKGEN